MKRLTATFLTLIIFIGLNGVQVSAEGTSPLRLVQTIPLAKVEGRIDHLTVDLKRKRLFIAALGNNTVEVVDLQAGKQSRTLRGFHEPQGILFIPELNRLIVANGGDGACQILDGDSLDVVKSIRLSNDADNIRYDEATKYLYVGYGEGGLAIIDAAAAKHLGDIKLAGHPEAFEFERSGSRIFVNVPTAKQIAVVDREKGIIVATWAFLGAPANFPMALDEPHHRLFVGLRKPPKLVVFDTESGQAIAALGMAGDCDDIFYDAARQRIYASCGGGFLNVFEQKDADHYRMIAKIPTVPGARTALLVPELGRLYLALPRHARQGAEIRVYEIQP